MLVKMETNSGGGGTVTRNTASEQISSGVITLNNVQGTVVCAIVRFQVSSTNLINVCDNVNDDIKYSQNGGSWASITKQKITQTGNTATITTTTTGSPTAEIVYYTI